MWLHGLVRRTPVTGRALARLSIAVLALIALIGASMAPSSGSIGTAGAQVSCPASGAADDGCGSMTVSPTYTSPGSTGQAFTFTFDSGNLTFPSNSLVALAVPSGWTKPQTGGGAGQLSISPPASPLTPCTTPATSGDIAGISSSSSSGPWVITLNLKCQSPHSGFNLTYSNVTAPNQTGQYTFTTQTQASGGSGHTLVTINSSPIITVTKATLATPVITSPASGSYTNAGTTATGPLIVSGEGVTGDTVTLYSESTSSCTDTSPTAVGSPVAVDSTGHWSVSLATVTAGVHNYAAQASYTSSTGKISTSSFSNCISITVDQTPPTASITSGPNGPTNNTTPTFSWTGSDNVSPTSALLYAYKLDGPGTTGTYSAFSSSTSVTLGGTTGLANGTYTLSVESMDQAGNISTPATQSFIIDTVAPTATILTGPSGPTNNNKPTFTWSGSDNVTTTANLVYAYRLDGPGTTTGTYSSFSSSTSATLGGTTGLADGTYTFSVESKDQAGNVSAPATQSFTLDTVPPVPPTFSSSLNGSYSNAGTSANSLSITGTAEAGSTVTLYESGTCGGSPLGTATASSSGSWTITLPNSTTTANVTEGSHTYTLTATDAAGNTSQCSSSITVDVDRTPPSSAITFPAQWTHASASAWSAGCGTVVGICGTASDTNSGVASVYVAIQSLSGPTNGLYWDAGKGTFSSTTVLWWKAQGTTSWSYAFSRPVDGTYAVASGAFDRAGNAEPILGNVTCGSSSGGLASTSGGACSGSGGLASTSGGLASTSGGLASTSGGLASTSGGSCTSYGGLASTSGGSGGCNEAGFIVDTVPPTSTILVDNQTQDGSVNINPAAKVSITFSEPMNQSSVTSSIHLSPGTLTASCGTDTSCQNVTISGLSAATYYTLTIGSVTDLAGNAQATTTVFHFTTALAPPVPATDSDGDGIPNAWDGTSFTVNGQSINTGAWGFNRLHKDLCLVEEYMAGRASDGITYDQHITQAANQAIVNAFANAPITNSDGTHGIHLVIFEGPSYSAGLPAGYSGPYYGGQIPMTDPLGNTLNGAFQFNVGYTSGAPSYDGIRNQYFVPTGLAQLCHLAVIAHSLGSTTSSGSSRGFGATDLVTALAIGTNGVGNQSQQEGTVMHELGHNLGLHHGGSAPPGGALPSDVDFNYKPNYLSVMNYYFQFTGLIQGGVAGNLGYSSSTQPLDETNLNEMVGLGAWASGYGTKHKCGSTSYVVPDATGPIDWNCDGVYESGLLSADTNNDSIESTLSSSNDWANLNFLGGTIGLGVGDTGSQGPQPTSSKIDTDPNEPGGVDSIQNVDTNEQQAVIGQPMKVFKGSIMNPALSCPDSLQNGDTFNVALIGTKWVNSSQIDPSTVQLSTGGVTEPPSSAPTVTDVTGPPPAGSTCTTQGGDGVMDLAAPFASAPLKLTTGTTVTLKVTAQTFSGTKLQYLDQVQVTQ